MLFLDEATLGLDVDARRVFWGQVRGLADAGRTVFFTTHYMEEAEVADRIALIDSGRIVALGTPRELKTQVGGGIVSLRTEDDARGREQRQRTERRTGKEAAEEGEQRSLEARS